MPPLDSVVSSFTSYQATNFIDLPDTCTLFDPQRMRIIVFHNNNSTEWHTCVAISKDYTRQVESGRNLEKWAVLLFLVAAFLTCLVCTGLLTQLEQLNASLVTRERNEIKVSRRGRWRWRR